MNEEKYQQPQTKRNTKKGNHKNTKKKYGKYSTRSLRIQQKDATEIVHTSGNMGTHPELR